jgi:CubicO group peptidase (beta-lactamase class C family)
MTVRRRAFLQAGIGLTWGPIYAAIGQKADDPVQKVEQGLDGEKGPASIQDRMAHYKVPGASVAVIRRGSIAWAKGYGVTEAGTAIYSSTRAAAIASSSSLSRI